jgi:Domain of unknown function (DUF222)
MTSRSLPPDRTKSVKSRLRSRETVLRPPLVEGEPVAPASQRYAEALVEMARRALQNVAVPARRSVDVTVLIDWQDYVNGGIARYADGTTLAPDRVRRLLCDAELNLIITGEHREPLWMSRKVRSAEYDRDNGPTDIDNLVLLCSTHHKLLHSIGFDAGELSQGLVEFVAYGTAVVVAAH